MGSVQDRRRPRPAFCDTKSSFFDITIADLEEDDAHFHQARLRALPPGVQLDVCLEFNELIAGAGEHIYRVGPTLMDVLEDNPEVIQRCGKSWKQSLHWLKAGDKGLNARGKRDLACLRRVDELMGERFLPELQALNSAFYRSHGLQSLRMALNKHQKSLDTFVERVNGHMAARIQKIKSSHRKGKGYEWYYPIVQDMLDTGGSKEFNPPDAKTLRKLGLQRGEPLGFLRKRVRAVGKSKPGSLLHVCDPNKPEPESEESDEEMPDANPEQPRAVGVAAVAAPQLALPAPVAVPGMADAEIPADHHEEHIEPPLPEVEPDERLMRRAFQNMFEEEPADESVFWQGAEYHLWAGGGGDVDPAVLRDHFAARLFFF